MPRLLAAPDKFRGTLSAQQAALAIAEAAEERGWEPDLAPVSDGGEGFLEVFASRLAARRRSRVCGPLGEPVEAEWLLCPPEGGGQQPWAVVESAQAIGLWLCGGPEGNDALRAGTTGVGQLVAEAARAGAGQVIVGLGGSATTDGGLGAVEALGWSGPASAGLVVACDVQASFQEAAALFSPQKGASPAQVGLLERRLSRVARLYEQRLGRDVRHLPGGGAAGGLGGGLAALGAYLVPGFELVARRLGLAERVAQADLVVTGEGYVDRQSFTGKAVGGVVALARAAGVPFLVVAGDGEAGLPVGYVSLARSFGPGRAREDAAGCLRAAVAGRLG